MRDLIDIVESEFQNVLPAPERWLDPAHREHRPGMSDFAKGGKYLEMPSKSDLTGETAAHGFIDVYGPRPTFRVSSQRAEPTTKADGKLLRVNLFKQAAGWKWVSDDLLTRGVTTVVSVNGSGFHVYALRVEFKKPVTLARYAESRTEPRLRPTLHGHIKMGQTIGSIVARSRPHVVYDTLEIF